VRGPGGGSDFPVSGVGRNPPAGEWIYFYLKQKPDSEVRLEIRDARDSVVQRWSTKPASPQDSLRLTAGLNRFVWDLSYPGAHRFPGIVLWRGASAAPPPCRVRTRWRLRRRAKCGHMPFARTSDGTETNMYAGNIVAGPESSMLGSLSSSTVAPRLDTFNFWFHLSHSQERETCGKEPTRWNRQHSFLSGDHRFCRRSQEEMIREVGELGSERHEFFNVVGDDHEREARTGPNHSHQFSLPREVPKG